MQITHALNNEGWLALARTMGANLRTRTVETCPGGYNADYDRTLDELIEEYASMIYDILCSKQGGVVWMEVYGKDTDTLWHDYSRWLEREWESISQNRSHRASGEDVRRLAFLDVYLEAYIAEKKRIRNREIKRKYGYATTSSASYATFNATFTTNWTTPNRGELRNYPLGEWHDIERHPEGMPYTAHDIERYPDGTPYPAEELREISYWRNSRPYHILTRQIDHLFLTNVEVITEETAFGGIHYILEFHSSDAVQQRMIFTTIAARDRVVADIREFLERNTAHLRY